MYLWLTYLQTLYNKCKYIINMIKHTSQTVNILFLLRSLILFWASVFNFILGNFLIIFIIWFLNCYDVQCEYFFFIHCVGHPVDTFNQEVYVSSWTFIFYSLSFLGGVISFSSFFPSFCSRSLFLAFWRTLFLQLYPGFEFKLSYLSAFLFRFQHFKIC